MDSLPQVENPLTQAATLEAPPPGPGLRIMMVAGERSGDIYGAALARTLAARAPDVEIFGCGGDAMRDADVDTLVDAHRIAVAGITEVIGGMTRVYRAFHRLLEEADRRRPAVAVLIDFPDFNLRLAKKLKQRGIPVVYFVSPQVWAWRQGRVQQLKRCVAKMIVIFDFEEEIYRSAGVPVEYVGHPLVDMARARQIRAEFFSGLWLDPAVPTIALLPGSRMKEVTANLPLMLGAAVRLAEKRQLQFVVAAAPTIDSHWLQGEMVNAGAGNVQVRTAVNATYDVLEYTDVAVVTSGTATLEAAIHERPMVVVYRVSGLTWLVGKALVKVPYYSIVNILAQRELVPELMQQDFTVANVVDRVGYLLDHPEAQEEMVRGFRDIRRRLGRGGAIERAAGAILAVAPTPGRSPR